jgi:hypothetical protein
MAIVDIKEEFADAIQSGPRVVVTALEGRGFGFINNGFNLFASCLTQPNDDEVVTVNRDKNVALPYYRMCQANEDNPYLPKVLEIIEGDGFFIARLERVRALDHLDVNENTVVRHRKSAEDLVAFLRGEKTFKNTDPLLKKAALLILELAADVYQRSDGKILPFCDKKAANVFWRETPAGVQYIFGDPLFPSSGFGENFAVNLRSMNKARRAFGLADIDFLGRPVPTKAPDLTKNQ